LVSFFASFVDFPFVPFVVVSYCAIGVIARSAREEAIPSCKILYKKVIRYVILEHEKQRGQGLGCRVLVAEY
jgi:hypothetical protein